MDFQNATRLERQTWLEGIINALATTTIAQVDRLLDEEKALGEAHAAQRDAHTFTRIAGVSRPAGMREYRDALASIDARMGEVLAGIPREAALALCWWRKNWRSEPTYAAACKRVG